MEILDIKQTGEIIRACRKAKNYTQFKLAEIAGIDEKQLGKIERGVHYPSVPTFLKIIEALKIDISIFYSDSSKNQTSSEIRLMKLINTSSEKELDMACQILELVRKF